MTEWWDPMTAGIVGAVAGGGLGTIGGVYGALAGILAPRGIGRTPMLMVHVLLLCAGVALLAAGGVALGIGQPYHVYYPLLLIGLILSIVMGALLPVIRMRYAQAEHRRLEADSIRRS